MVLILVVLIKGNGLMGISTASDSTLMGYQGEKLGTLVLKTRWVMARHHSNSKFNLYRRFYSIATARASENHSFSQVAAFAAALTLFTQLNP